MDRYSLESDPSARSKAHCGLEPHEPRPTIIVHRKRDVLGYKPCVLVSQRHTKSDLLQRIEKVKRLGHISHLAFRSFSRFISTSLTQRTEVLLSLTTSCAKRGLCRQPL